MATFGIKRIYEDPASEDGTRILVDRLWPRGISKERAALAGWHKELAPSPELRKWWGHDAARMDEFGAAYEAELDQRPEVDEFLARLAPDERVTLLYAAKDPRVNHARILCAYLTQRQQ